MDSGKRSEVLILVAMCFAVIVDGLDCSIVNVILPMVGAEFHTDTGTIAWVSIVYMMMIAGLLLPFGRVADGGRIRPVFIIGFVIFIAGSVACGLSNSVGMLIAARVLQGFGAAMIGCTAAMICVKFLPPSKLGLSLGVMVMASSIGWASGPALGGIITDCLSWQWAFYVNVPIGIVGILFGMFVLPKEKKETGRSLDILGTLSIFLAIVAAIYVMERFTYPESYYECVAMAAVSVLSLIVFIRTELTHKDPMIDVRLFKNLKMTSVLLSYFLINVLYMGLLYIIPFYLELIVGITPSFTGIVLLLPSLVCLAVSIPVGRYCDLHGRRGFAVFAGFMCLVFSLGLYVMTPEMGWLPFVPIGVAGGLVWGFCGSACSSRIIDQIQEKDKGMGSALVTFGAYVGSAIGTAAFASLMMIGAGAVGTPIELLTRDAFMDGFTFTIYWGIAMSVMVIFTAWVVKDDIAVSKKVAEA